MAIKSLRSCKRLFQPCLTSYAEMVPLPGGLLSDGGENGVVTLVIMLTDEMPADGVI